MHPLFVRRPFQRSICVQLDQKLTKKRKHKNDNVKSRHSAADYSSLHRERDTEKGAQARWPATRISPHIVNGTKAQRLVPSFALILCTFGPPNPGHWSPPVCLPLAPLPLPLPYLLDRHNKGNEYSSSPRHSQCSCSCVVLSVK